MKGAGEVGRGREWTDNAHFRWRICWMNDMLMGNRELISEINMLSFWHSFQRKSDDDDDDAMHSREICTKILLCESFSECSASIWIHFDCSATATAATTMHSSSRLSKLWRKCRTATRKKRIEWNCSSKAWIAFLDMHKDYVNNIFVDSSVCLFLYPFRRQRRCDVSRALDASAAAYQSFVAQIALEWRRHRRRRRLDK